MPSAEDYAVGGGVLATVVGAVVKAWRLDSRLEALERDVKALRDQIAADKIEQARASADSDPPPDAALARRLEDHIHESNEQWLAFTKGISRLEGILEGQTGRFRR